MIDDEGGIEGLLASLSAIGAGSLLTLPGVDDPTPASTYMRQVLEAMRERDVTFDEAWSAGINRIQAPQGEGGFIEDPRVGALVLEERTLLEEARPLWQAAFERREPVAMERARVTVRAWERFEGGPPRVATKRAA